MLTQSEYALRMMEIRGGVSLIDTLIAYRECRAPLKPRCLFGPTDKTENLKFAKTALLNDSKAFFKRYSLIEPSEEDLLFELCHSVKRRLEAVGGESGRKVRKLDSVDRKRREREERQECEGANRKSPCLVTPMELRTHEHDARQTHITEFWQIRKPNPKASSKSLPAPSLPSSTATVNQNHSVTLLPVLD